jgi:hypothetical protein
LIFDATRVEIFASLALQWTRYSPVLDSDSLYHRLFSIPCMVEMLVREFVPQTLAAGLDFSRLQRVNERKLKAGERLPPLLLLVLYNGLMCWKAPTQIRKLIALAPDSALWPWQPQVRYYLLDLGAFPGDELARRRSLAALLFRLERPPETEELKGLLGEVSGWFSRHPD